MDKEWDPPAQEFGALVPIYGTIVTSVITDCCSYQFRYRPFLTELGAYNWLKRPLGIAIELSRLSQVLFMVCRGYLSAPLLPTYFQEPVSNVLSSIPIVGARLSRSPAFWYCLS